PAQAAQVARARAARTMANRRECASGGGFMVGSAGFRGKGNTRIVTRRRGAANTCEERRPARRSASVRGSRASRFPAPVHSVLARTGLARTGLALTGLALTGLALGALALASPQRLEQTPPTSSSSPSASSAPVL